MEDLPDKIKENLPSFVNKEGDGDRALGGSAKEETSDRCQGTRVAGLHRYSHAWWRWTIYGRNGEAYRAAERTRSMARRRCCPLPSRVLPRS